MAYICLNTNFKRDIIILNSATKPGPNIIKHLFVRLETTGDLGGPHRSSPRVTVSQSCLFTVAVSLLATLALAANAVF